MAGSLSDAMEVDVLKSVTGQATTILTTTPIVPWIALYTVAPTDSTAGTECTGGSYARVTSAGLWATPSAGSVTNNAAVTFAQFSGAIGGAVVAFSIMTAVTAGSMVVYGTLTDPTKVFGNLDTASFPASSLTITAS
jgi:hypothetical protein